jgi:hypothetical protein|nr:MAG TPA: hypothetical protein [Caudoviricetes sp.]
MAYIDNELIFCNDVATATSVTSGVLDIGLGGAFVHPLFIDVKLTAPVTSGKVETITVQSSATEAFAAPVTEMSVTVPVSVNQTKKAATLAQFYAPIRAGNRYVRLVIAGTNPTGGKLTAYMSTGTAVNL